MPPKFTLRRFMFGWRRNVHWSGAIQWLLLLTLLTPMLLFGGSASRMAVAGGPVAAGASPADGASRIDPRILQVAEQSPEQSVRIIVQKVIQDQSVEQLVLALGGQVLSDLPIINAFAAEVPAAAALQLAQSQAVRWISIDAEVHSSLLGLGGDKNVSGSLNTYLDTMGIAPIWNQGINGQGIGVAVIDSGIARDTDFTNLAITKGFNINSVTPLDLYGHGTHIAGIIAGNGVGSYGKNKGVAPGATLIGLKASNDLGLAFESDVVKALQWIYDHKETYNIRVINLSINSGVETSYHQSALNAAAEVLWFSGVVVVVSAGNSGEEGGYNTILAPPANDPFLITVGASDERGTSTLSDDVIAAYSAEGKTLDGYSKPDIIAPGTGIYSVLSQLSPWSLLYHDRVSKDGEYFRMSGTSMAAPMVVGVITLLLQDEPDLTPDQVKYRLLNSTNRTLSSPVEGASLSYPYIDALAAINGTSTESANTGLQASQLLWTGTEPINWSSVNWNSVNWNSVNWNSVNWNSVNWNSVNWNSTVLEPPTVGGILPLAEGESWETPAMPTEVPDIDFGPQLDQVIDSFLYLPSLEQ